MPFTISLCGHTYSYQDQRHNNNEERHQESHGPLMFRWLRLVLSLIPSVGAQLTRLVVARVEFERTLGKTERRLPISGAARAPDPGAIILWIEIGGLCEHLVRIISSA
jgi:hypothetical protein